MTDSGGDFKKQDDGATDQEPAEAESFDTNWDDQVESFDDMNLKETLLRGIYAYGFEKPSPIQQKGIKPVVEGRDTIAQAQSGTGKTATFVISALQIIEEQMRDCQVLVLAPTRELAQQIHKVTMHLGDYMNIQSHACVGGTAVRDDIRIMQTGVQMVVGTPGRVNDMINRNALKLDQLKAFILDEADEMLSRGFKDQIYDVFQYLPANVQVCLFSATMPIEILNITSRFMRDPVRILDKKEQLTLDEEVISNGERNSETPNSPTRDSPTRDSSTSLPPPFPISNANAAAHQQSIAGANFRIDRVRRTEKQVNAHRAQALRWAINPPPLKSILKKGCARKKYRQLRKDLEIVEESLTIATVKEEICGLIKEKQWIQQELRLLQLYLAQ